MHCLWPTRRGGVHDNPGSPHEAISQDRRVPAPVAVLQLASLAAPLQGVARLPLHKHAEERIPGWEEGIRHEEKRFPK